ncbi:uncharacterized protein K452DRAFT_307243 [Aplosporella prunicola CBS 121167]|uniref:Uncharacterized protein n=1 Tax=Aplosporella prunicola CBS 121167 TaxID=1176127 RepID=A0A6A6BIC7_9PEZI|nr:uncharacterized protein K452DRAFT_307243 [Aplosporella prunicola CBS 121167]KAF2143890.1 hypothetical protein K452DRAFT_307243 [Aplosporella prunicola CBS 121167]
MKLASSPFGRFLALAFAFLFTVVAALPIDDESSAPASQSLSRRNLPKVSETNKKEINEYLRDATVHSKDFIPSDRWPTAVYDSFGTKPFSIGTPKVALTGCLAVVVVGPGGVWMGHMWECPGFTKNPPEGWDKIHFQPEVIDFLKNGVATVAEPEKEDTKPPKVPKLSDLKHELDHANVYFIGLSKGMNENSYWYSGKMKKVQETIAALIPNPTFIHKFYPPGDGSVDVLFEYDGKSKKARLMYTDHNVVFERNV